MKSIALALLGTIVLIHAQDASKNSYMARWESLNVKEIVDNGRIFSKYKQCLTMDRVPGCPQEIQELKDMLIDALESMCDKCSAAQLTKVRESLAYVCKMRGPDFIEIFQHFDPTGAKRAQFESKFGKLDC